MLRMAKKTGMSDSSLWVIAIMLLAIAAWTFFKK
jgi:LPXTG-motif cell wall-anchored protein